MGRFVRNAEDPEAIGRQRLADVGAERLGPTREQIDQVSRVDKAGRQVLRRLVALEMELVELRTAKDLETAAWEAEVESEPKAKADKWPVVLYELARTAGHH